MTAQAHDYSTAPFGVWDTTEDTTMADEREAAITRLMRPSVGATSRAQAEVLVDEIGVDTIRAESDEDLAARVANPESVVTAPEHAVIADVLAEVGDDPVKAQVALDAEKAGKGRTTLLAKLEAVVAASADDAAAARDASETPATSTPVDPDGESDSAGVEAQSQVAPNEVEPAPGDPGAQVDKQPHPA